MGEFRPTNTSDAILISSPSDALLKILGDLKIPLETFREYSVSQPVITRQACEAAHVSFEFFQAFAKLTRPKATDAPYQPTGNARYFESRDRQLDRIEVMHLVQTLWQLDSKDGRAKSSSFDLQNLDLVKSRINLLGANSCWLTSDALWMGLFQSLNGNLSPRMTWYPSADGKGDPFRLATPPKYFRCSYLPELEPLVHGLSYDVQNTPPEIRKAASSTLRLTLEGRSGGSGVVVLYPGYLLTARHVLTAADSPLPQKMEILVQGTERKDGPLFRVNAEVLKLDSFDWLPHDLDLALLYVGNQLPADIPALPFADSVARHQPVYLLGFPDGQEGDMEKALVQTGLLDVLSSRPLMFHTNVVAFPGNSGGPMVDSQGRLLGIVKSVSMENEDAEGYYPKEKILRSGQEIETANISGSYAFNLRIVLPAIRQAIEAHRKK